LFISTAAVSDYRALEQHAQKMKKQGQNKVELELTENPDIVAYVSKHRLCDFVVGFAAETQHLENYAKTKLETKGLDLIIANLVGVKGSGFNSDDNEVVMYGAQGQEVAFEKKTKNALAYDLMNVIAQQMKSKEEKINATSTS
jgi:phosphopantothenoylcysteine decarboxylase/phosphopantothenate--cysteine ligase